MLDVSELQTIEHDVIVVGAGQVVSVCGLLFLLRRPQQHGRHKARNRLASPLTGRFHRASSQLHRASTRRLRPHESLES